MKQLKVLIFGASGMVGQSIVRECLLDKDVQEISCIGRSPLDIKHAKIIQIVSRNLYDLSEFSEQLKGYDACFFTLGASAANLSENEYAKINYELPLSAAQLLVKLNPQMVFVYVSGTGSDSTERGPIMWARVKGKTENMLMKLPFKGAYMFRPAAIIPKHGESSRTALYRYFYIALKPFYPLVEKISAKYVINTEDIARAMLKVAKTGQGPHIFESADIKNAATS